MRDIATAQLSGNLATDVDLRTLPSGAEAARLRVASTSRRRTGEEWTDKTNLYTVEVYGAQAGNCARYLRKGSRVFVEGELDWREWTDKHDQRREAVTIRARTVLFEGPRNRDTAPPESTPAPSAAPAFTPTPAPPAAEPAAAGTATPDDIPF
jgi:single-strand DNA-binding protein